MMHYGGYGGMYMWLFFLAIAVLVIYFIFKRDNSDDRRMILPDESPLDILKKRYARGEITKEEYDRLKRDIEDRRD